MEGVEGGGYTCKITKKEHQIIKKGFASFQTQEKTTKGDVTTTEYVFMFWGGAGNSMSRPGEGRGHGPTALRLQQIKKMQVLVCFGLVIQKLEIAKLLHRSSLACFEAASFPCHKYKKSMDVCLLGPRI